MQRKAAKRERLARQKANPYYLDGGKGDVDVDSIPIVKLELDDAPPEPAKSKPPAEVVRTDEVPEGAQINGQSSTSKPKKKKHAIDVDLSAASSATAQSTNASTGKFEEYVVDGEEDKAAHKPTPTPSPPPPPQQPVEEATIAAPEAVSVVKVKRKKKKPVA